MSMHQEENAAKPNFLMRLGATLWRWIKRMFWGEERELLPEEKATIERIESPGKMAITAYFHRKLAVAALAVLMALFALVFIGPYMVPMDLNYTDSLQANMAPNYTLLNVPSKLEKQVRDINGFSNFTVGIDKENNLYICI